MTHDIRSYQTYYSTPAACPSPRAACSRGVLLYGSLVIGTDYGHTDPSSELDAISVFLGQEGTSQDTKDRILHHNPKTLYNL